MRCSASESVARRQRARWPSLHECQWHPEEGAGSEETLSEVGEERGRELPAAG